MSPVNNFSMHINDGEVKVTKINNEDYICLTDMAKSSGSERALHSWLRSRNTLLFLGLWEQLHNSDFNLHEFVKIKSRAGENSFNPSIKEWVETTNAIGIISKTGRYGGTYAHKDIAFEFGTWLSPEFKLLIITEFQRLKAREQSLVEWDSRRYLSRVNYRLHTEAIKTHIIPTLGSGAIQTFTYTNEADMLNIIVFGQTASDWKNKHPQPSNMRKNQRDYASTIELVVVANLESLNSHLIAEGKSQQERFEILRETARQQLQALIDVERVEKDSKKKALS